MNWISFDGFLHIIICFIILSITSFNMEMGWAVLITILVAAGKEAYDYAKKKNNLEQVMHDLICDGVGMMLVFLIYFLSE